MKFFIQDEDVDKIRGLCKFNKISVNFWDVRSCNEKDFDIELSHIEGKWRSKGKNHCQCDLFGGTKGIKRQLDNKSRYVIDITNMHKIHTLLCHFYNIFLEPKNHNMYGKDALPEIRFNIREY